MSLLLVIGDFNGYMCPTLDKHPPASVGPQFRGTVLSRFVPKVGRIDLWRRRNPGQCQFSCFSKTCMSLSRIGLCLVSPNGVAFIAKLQYANRSVFDHAPVVVWLSAKPCINLPRPTWKLNPFCLNLLPDRLVASPYC